MAVTIKQKAYKKMYAYCKKAKHGEIGGLILGKLENTGDITVKDVMLMEQVRTNSDFEISDENMMDFTKNATSKVLKSVIGWWHYHLQYGTFWSDDDGDCFTRLTKLSNFCLGIVTSIPLDSKKMDMRCRLDMYNREGNYVSVDGIESNIDKKEFFKIDWKNIGSEVNNLVKTDERHWITCPTCHGLGRLVVKNKKQGKNTQIVVKQQGNNTQIVVKRHGALTKEEQEYLDDVVGGQNYGKSYIY